MVKPLSWKGDKKPAKKRKREAQDNNDAAEVDASKKQLIAAEAAPDDDNWVSADAVSDIAGPVILVFATEPVSCLAVDSFGKVFTSKIENMVESEPATAEPHDVRQVWVSQRIVGMENSFTFKGHHGKYLGCDRAGLLSSTREAVSSEETFKCTLSADKPGHFDVQSMRSTYFAVDGDKDPPEIRGDAEETGETTSVRIRMQARFKPKHKSDMAEKVRSKISRKELEAAVGRRLEDDEVKMLKKARKEGNYHEAMLDVKVKGKHDKYA